MTPLRWTRRMALSAPHSTHLSRWVEAAVPAGYCLSVRKREAIVLRGRAVAQGAGAAGPPRLAPISQAQPLGQPVLRSHPHALCLPHLRPRRAVVIPVWGKPSPREGV